MLYYYINHHNIQLRHAGPQYMNFLTTFPHRYRAHWDGLAVLLSGICLVHCLLLPQIVGLFPLLGASILGHQQFHQVLLFLVLPTSVIGLGLGFRRHHKYYTLVTGAIGVAMLVAISLIAHDLVDSATEIIIASVGGLIVAASHILNFIETRKTSCAEAGCSS
jgi:hypothetical protein